MYDTKIDRADIVWTPLDFPGVSMKVLLKNESTGGMTVMTRIAPGSLIPAHRHTQADETVYVIEGDFIEDSINYGPGSFFAARAGTPHGSTGGCVLLTTFQATLDFVVEQPAPAK